MPYALLAALGVREGFRGPQGDPVERLIDALEGREVLLVLDNCEHLVDEAARTAGVLLGACPGLRVLATSREALGITGEALCPVPPLAAGPAARLFMDRAAAVRPDADLHARVEAVHGICEALDGLPLAIELAAARLRTLTVDELADRLGDRFRLLSRGDRTKAPRHRTLRAVVEWSWELLDEEERDLARRMAVFAGGSSGVRRSPRSRPCAGCRIRRTCWPRSRRSPSWKRPVGATGCFRRSARSAPSTWPTRAS